MSSSDSQKTGGVTCPSENRTRRVELIYSCELFAQNVRGVISVGQGETISIVSELSPAKVMSYTPLKQRQLLLPLLRVVGVLTGNGRTLV